ncbi:MAG: hypothetical protein ACKO1M_00525, partial [Planctomycetota bacterium]
MIGPRITSVTIPRPQPVGLFTFPTSHLLLPACDEPGAAEALRRLVRGDLSAAVPARWEFFVAAARGDEAAANLVAGGDAVSACNRFILDPTPAALDALVAGGDPLLAALARSAAFAHGLVDDVADAPALDGELRAVVLITLAAARIEQRRLGDAAAALEAAVELAAATSPLLAAIAIHQFADLAPALVPPRDPLPLFRRALDLAADAALPLVRAELL